MSSNQNTTRKKKFILPPLANVQFTGMNVRHDQDVNGDDYMSAFRFRDGEFGNWMPNTDQRVALNMGYEALTAMAKALSISPEDISLGGRLAIAFGNRNITAAHYEPMREVINLTRMHGAGSLAHEWGHAMDDILAKAIGGYGLSDDKARKGLTDAQSRLHHDMRFTEKQVDVEEQRAALEANTKRLSDYGEQLIRSTMPAVTSLKPKQTQQQKKLITKVMNDRTIRCNECLPSIQTIAGSVNELSEFKKSVTGRGIPKKLREDITYYLGMANSEREAMEHLEPGTELQPSTYYQESKDFGKKFSKTDHGYWESECEMFARAFACYVHDKLEAMGVICDYAVGHAEFGPVPHGEERKRLNTDFDALIAEFKDRGLFHDYVEPELAPTNKQRTNKTNTKKANTATVQPNIIDLYEDGHSIKDISTQLHTHPSDVRHILHEAGYTDTRAYRKISPAMVRVVNVMLDHRVTYRDIETYCDISFDAVRGCVERSDRRTMGSPREYKYVSKESYCFQGFDPFLDRYDKGESFTSITENLALTDDQLYTIFYYLWSTFHVHEHQKNMAKHIQAQRESGFSIAAIAKRTHISHSIVRTICKQP